MKRTRITPAQSVLAQLIGAALGRVYALADLEARATAEVRATILSRANELLAMELQRESLQLFYRGLEARRAFWELVRAEAAESRESMRREDARNDARSERALRGLPRPIRTKQNNPHHTAVIDFTPGRMVAR